MKLFLDTSVLLSACNSQTGASSVLFDLAETNDWELIASPWVVTEVTRNLIKFPPSAELQWKELFFKLMLTKDVVSLNQPVVFSVTKDRPVLISALASADVLLTLDREDFMALLGNDFYGMAILLPSEFLKRERTAGRLKNPTI